MQNAGQKPRKGKNKMETESIYNEISSLPPEAQRQVKGFVAFLRLRYRTPAKNETGHRQKLSDEAFIGIWKDREEMKDSDKWLRTVRKTEWGEPSA
jgi:hypothetical protein